MTKSMVTTLGNLCGKPFNKLNAVFIPTAANAEAGDKGWLIKDYGLINKLKFKQLDIVDFAAFEPKLALERIKQADVIFTGGGNTFYLSFWFEKTGFFKLLPTLLKTRVYVGISAGSMIVTDSLRFSSQSLAESRVLNDEEYQELGPKGQSLTKTAKLVNFVIRPHLNSKWFPNITLKKISKVAKELNTPLYAIDDQTAVVVKDNKVEVVSEGNWQRFN